MWDKTTIYNSSFFDWVWNGNMWISHDPIDTTRRWIIKDSDTNYQGSTIKFMGYYLKDSIPEGGARIYGTSEAHVAYCLVGRRIEQIADVVYSRHNAASNEEQDKAREVLMGLVFLKPEPGNSNVSNNEAKEEQKVELV